MRNSYQLFSERVRDLLRTWKKRRSGTYIVVSGRSRSLKSGDLSLWRVFGIRVFVILGCLSICECDEALVCDAQDISIHEYSWGPHMATWYPSASLSRWSYSQPSPPFFLLVHDVSVGLGGIMSWRCRWFIKDPLSSFSEVDNSAKVVHPPCLLLISQFICRKHPHQLPHTPWLHQS